MSINIMSLNGQFLRNCQSRVRSIWFGSWYEAYHKHERPRPGATKQVRLHNCWNIISDIESRRDITSINNPTFAHKYIWAKALASFVSYLYSPSTSRDSLLARSLTYISIVNIYVHLLHLATSSNISWSHIKKTWLLVTAKNIAQRADIQTTMILTTWTTSPKKQQ